MLELPKVAGTNLGADLMEQIIVPALRAQKFGIVPWVDASF